MPRKSISDVVDMIKRILEKEGELSIRQLALKTKSQWRTIRKALDLMKSLGVVEERKSEETERIERLFRLK